MSAHGERDHAAIEGDGGQALILAIDDDPNMIELLRENLSEAGYRVVAAAGGDEGLRTAREIRPAAIVPRHPDAAQRTAGRSCMS